jgi:hypothetical protein
MGDNSLRTARSHKANPFLIDRSSGKTGEIIGGFDHHLAEQGGHSARRVTRGLMIKSPGPHQRYHSFPGESFEGSGMRVSEG